MMRSGRAALVAGALLAATSGLGACSAPERDAPPPAARDSRPNVLFVVWDTVRADRLSLYGYPKSTTPHLERFAERARVFESCVSAGSSTVPSHASMFTGLLPSEHGANNANRRLDASFHTLAELFSDAGYQTYLFAANPHITGAQSFAQGFDVEEHPWDPAYRARARRILERKLRAGDLSSELPGRLRSGEPLGPWSIKAAGELARVGTEAFLARRDPERPWLVFLNYMEAHRPFLPAAEHRRRLMTPEEVEASYLVDRSWLPMWSYVFGLHEYSDAELELMAATYDATLVELDELFHELLGALEAAGQLENTVVVLTADHGEHLGEHGLLDHQYSLYQGLIRVPLVLHAPGRVPAGRDARPVMNLDVFPTLLELADIEPPPGSRGVSLLEPEPGRVRLAEYPVAMPGPIELVKRLDPAFDDARWRRRLRAYVDGAHKLIWSSDGEHELYDLASDPDEQHNLISERPERARELLDALERYASALRAPAGGESQELEPEQRERLEALGYLESP